MTNTDTNDEIDDKIENEDFCETRNNDHRSPTYAPQIESTTGALRMIVIYHHARDYPQHNYVARQWWVIASKVWPAPGLFAHGTTLRAVRAAVPSWMVCIPHLPGEDEVIIETWI
jgi:hypothetical protein